MPEPVPSPPSSGRDGTPSPSLPPLRPRRRPTPTPGLRDTACLPDLPSGVGPLPTPAPPPAARRRPQVPISAIGDAPRGGVPDLCRFVGRGAALARMTSHRDRPTSASLWTPQPASVQEVRAERLSHRPPAVPSWVSAAPRRTGCTCVVLATVAPPQRYVPGKKSRPRVSPERGYARVPRGGVPELRYCYSASSRSCGRLAAARLSPSRRRPFRPSACRGPFLSRPCLGRGLLAFSSSSMLVLRPSARPRHSAPSPLRVPRGGCSVAAGPRGVAAPSVEYLLRTPVLVSRALRRAWSRSSPAWHVQRSRSPRSLLHHVLDRSRSKSGGHVPHMSFGGGSGRPTSGSYACRMIPSSSLWGWG